MLTVTNLSIRTKQTKETLVRSVSFSVKSGEVLGLFILHPNNIGRCGHVANASYLMDKRFRGQKLGRAL